MDPLNTSTGTALNAVLVELQAQSILLGMIFWLLIGIGICIMIYFIWKFFDHMMFKHLD